MSAEQSFYKDTELYYKLYPVRTRDAYLVEGTILNALSVIEKSSQDYKSAVFLVALEAVTTVDEPQFKSNPLGIKAMQLVLLDEDLHPKSTERFQAVVTDGKWKVNTPFPLNEAGGKNFVRNGFFVDELPNHPRMIDLQK